MRRAQAFLLALAPALPAAGATYEVGPGQALARIADVPWESLAPGDTVLIYWRPAPYQEKWVIGTSGASDSPITVRGVRGPGGERPVIDGRDAVTPTRLDYWNEDRSVVKVGGTSIPPDVFPEYIVIEGLEIRSARPPHVFTDDGGNPGSYRDNAAAIHVEKGRHVTIRDCVLRDSGNGLFVSSSTDWASEDILVESNHVFDNGIDGSIYQHNNYTEALAIVFQFNRFGPPRAGCLGNNLKDRSAGLVVRYNWIEGGNRQLDLVDAEDSTLLVADPSYRETLVYGNVLVETEDSGNRQVVHYGGDSGALGDYRKGTLHFYNNTVISRRTDRTTLFRLSSNDERCDARNNIVFLSAAAGDTLSLLDGDGVLDWSHQWTEPGWVDSFGGLTGVINDDGTSLTGGAPGFVDEGGDDLHLAASSPCIDAGTDLAPDLPPGHDPARAYGVHQGMEARGDESPLDIGAYARACPGDAPGEVPDLRFADARRFGWAAAAEASSYDLIRGRLSTLAVSGLAGSLGSCLESDDPDRLGADPELPGVGEGFWYLVRGRACAGTRGTYDVPGTGRDLAIAGSPADCP